MSPSFHCSTIRPAGPGVSLSMLSANDEQLLRRAVSLAEKGLYTTRPNPRVGCVIARQGRVIGEGWHSHAGEGHAEINALANASDSTEGAHVYVSLEPCSHHGKTPPCVDALIQAKVERVVIAMADPNPKVFGEGIRALQAAGIAVDVAESDFGAVDLNRGFVMRMTQDRPQIRLKIASTLDGRTAAQDGSSRWITGREARADVHRLRARSCAVITGVGTVLDDDPRLTARVEEPIEQPMRVIVQGQRRVPSGARLFAEEGRIVLIAPDAHPKPKVAANRTNTVSLPSVSGRVDLHELVAFLAGEECNEVLVEAGPTLSGAFLKAGLVDELWVYQSASMLGHQGRAMLELDNIPTINDQISLSLTDVMRIGEDLRLIYVPRAVVH